MPSYKPRLIDRQIDDRLRSVGALVIEGAKACGKTTTAARHCNSELRLDRSPAVRDLAKTDPMAVLAGPVPRLIDEWQLAPEVWNAVRGEVDERQAKGQFVLTGSASPADDITRHSGAMRFGRLTMRPMSLLESGDSTGQVSLAKLWAGENAPSVLEESNLSDTAEAAARGGWPSNLGLSTKDCLQANMDYLRTIASADIVTVDGVRRDPRKVEALLRSLGRNTGTYVSNRVLLQDTAAFGASIDIKTLATYLDALARLWVLDEQPAWGGHLRSSARARQAAKRHMVDPSLAVVAMGATPEALLDDREAFGQVFETLVHRDLAVYGQADGLDVLAFQDSNGKEIDAVLVQGTQWAGIEVKLSPVPAVLDAGAANLQSIAARMSTSPRFLALVTGSGLSYTRSDGVHVISVAHLGL